ncbi:hypothetical protein J7T55_001274 [Diaporthe amygdali]|uniref:uncharacterized protein n=1 Tax=Phomopsis amygdali TaxID=1214568 RepID=UPI0022FEFDBC|nr:uncharacterized protein J7T55_001274 [Diaporthe amygdali]KAJ0106750.1 hypothetical protein J7T55_001274 [Diaporthe amygdali]
MRLFIFLRKTNLWFSSKCFCATRPILAIAAMQHFFANRQTVANVSLKADWPRMQFQDAVGDVGGLDARMHIPVLNTGYALVTGAAAGIGKEAAFAFAEAGVEGVAFADLNEQGAQEAAAESKNYATNANYQSLVIKVDVADENVVQHMVDAVVKAFGWIDYAVNSAGVKASSFFLCPNLEISARRVDSSQIGNISGAITPNLKLDVFDKSVDINIKGAVYFVRAVTAAMAAQDELTHVSSSRHGNTTRSLGRGSIVLLGSITSYITGPGMLNYTTSKHAVIGITKSAAMDCINSRIRVNAVCPSWVDTPMNHASLQRMPQLGHLIKAISSLGRVATVEEVADYIVFLSSPSASYINGTGLTIDSGISMGIHVPGSK